MAIATLFAMSACSDDDSSSTPNNPPAPPVTDLCAGKVAGATCDTGKTCQDESGKLVCKTKPAEPPVTDLCAGKVAGDTCDTGKTCQDEGGKLVCKTKPAEPPVTDLCAGKVAGDTCDTGKTCQDEGGKLVCRLAKPNPEVDLCAGKVAGDTCDTGKTCQDEGGKLVCRVPKHEGIDDATQWACGTNICSGSQYCNTKTSTCVDRVEKAVADRDCKASTFVENCDGNKLVYCNPDGKTTVTDCSEDKKGDKTAVCALRRNENHGVCVFQDDRCNAETVGEISLCIDTKPGTTENISYVEYLDCERASDGDFYMFKTFKTRDCNNVCLDETLCVDTGIKCEKNSFESRCDGDKLLVCGDDGQVWGTNCRDFNVDCIVDAQEGAMCDYANMPMP